MAWKTEIKLKNNTPDDLLFTIPKGQLFENKKIGSGIQNVAAAREYKLIVPGHSRIIVEIEVLCINQSLSPPSGMSGNIAVFKINKDFGNQNDLWANMNSQVI